MAELTFNPTSGANNRLYFSSASGWAAARDSATAEGVQINGIADGNFVSGTTYSIARIGEVFDTSSLPDNAVISAAEIQLYVTAKVDTDTVDLDIVSFSPSDESSLVVADYAKANWGTSSYSSVAYSAITTGQYTTWTLDSNGITSISKTGNSVFGCRVNTDTDNTTPTGSNRLTWDTNNSGNPEKLVVTYTLPVTGGNPMTFQGGGLAVG